MRENLNDYHISRLLASRIFGELVGNVCWRYFSSAKSTVQKLQMFYHSNVLYYTVNAYQHIHTYVCMCACICVCKLYLIYLYAYMHCVIRQNILACDI